MEEHQDHHTDQCGDERQVLPADEGSVHAGKCGCRCMAAVWSPAHRLVLMTRRGTRMSPGRGGIFVAPGFFTFMSPVRATSLGICRSSPSLGIHLGCVATKMPRR